MATDDITTAQRIREGSKVLPKRNKGDIWNPMRIVLDRETIQNAERRNSYNCMIADGIKQLLNLPGSSVRVDLGHIRIYRPDLNLRFIYMTPVEAQRRLVFFDQGVHVEPWLFHIGKPAQIVRPRGKRVPTEETPEQRAARIRRRDYHRERRAAAGTEVAPGKRVGAAMRQPNDDLGPPVAIWANDCRVDETNPGYAPFPEGGNSQRIIVGGDELPIPGQLKARRRFGAKDFIE